MKRWYKNGKFIPDDTPVNDDHRTYTIVKVNKNTIFSFNGYTFYIGYIENDIFIGLYDIKDLDNNPENFKNKAKLKIFAHLNHSDIINIKLGNVNIMNPQCSMRWTYDEIEKIFGEDGINFYR